MGEVADYASNGIILIFKKTPNTSFQKFCLQFLISLGLFKKGTKKSRLFNVLVLFKKNIRIILLYFDCFLTFVKQF